MFAWLAALLTATPCFYLTFMLVAAWVDPLAWDNGRWVRFGVGLLALEFVLLHSSGFMSAIYSGQLPHRKRYSLMTGLLLFYSAIVWAFAETFDSYRLIIIFAAITLGRIISMVQAASRSRDAMSARSALGIVLYVLIGFLTVAVAVPELGVTREVLDQVYPGRGGGLWERHPERAMAGAALYFFLVGFAELFYFRNTPAVSDTTSSTAGA